MSKGDGDPASAARVHVLRKLPGSVWETVFQTPPTTDPFRHDNWSPALSVYHYPGEPEGAVGVYWYTTIDDLFSPTKNEYLRLYGTVSMKSGDIGSWDVKKDVDKLSPPQIVDDYLGKYQGLAGLPHLSGAFLAAWGDQREVGATDVWSVRVQHQ